MRKDSGFTLIELMVTVTVAAVLLGVGIPSFTQLIKNNRKTTVVNSLVTDIHKARAEAYARNQRVVLCQGNGSTAAPDCAGGGEWTQGWIAFVDANTNGNFDTGSDAMLASHAAPPPGINIHSNLALLDFRRFSAVTSATIQICIDNDPGNEPRAIILSRGRPRLSDKKPDHTSLDCQ